MKVIFFYKLKACFRWSFLSKQTKLYSITNQLFFFREKSLTSYFISAKRHTWYTCLYFISKSCCLFYAVKLLYIHKKTNVKFIFSKLPKNGARQFFNCHEELNVKVWLWFKEVFWHVMMKMLMTVALLGGKSQPILL